ncbi:a3a08028-4175-4d55-97a5-c05514323add [Sclerotinia trifoliorum]|uniref:A3a08028-4175-4d55-97a5-c05514323add n=1 Tax=Sclerotinia trifoliorum TaxID=28548 RepID=A0A8H2ZJG2_9HELO|nr:a3a08028-4175-4d55-97a5-c05514323add [Sclerotinia trifoliorum]
MTRCLLTLLNYIPSETSLETPNLSNGHKEISAHIAPLHPFTGWDAREIVRLVQCPLCSKILHEPVTLPCGNTICRECISSSSLWRISTTLRLSYVDSSRDWRFTCPLPTCEQEHTGGDTSTNPDLKIVIDAFDTETTRQTNVPKPAWILLKLNGFDPLSVQVLTSLLRQSRSSCLGGKITATYLMANMGKLPYNSDAFYKPYSYTMETCRSLDADLLDRLKNSIKPAFNCCQLCQDWFLEPVTAGCGHSTCRTCLQELLDLENFIHRTSVTDVKKGCPSCRQILCVPPACTPDVAPTNKLLDKLLNRFFPEELAIRRKEAEDKTRIGTKGTDLSLFIDTVCFPTQMRKLHVWQPSYIVMIENLRHFPCEKRLFGMLFPNPCGIPQGNLGSVPFREYGTLVHLTDMARRKNGTYDIVVEGVSCFKVLQHDTFHFYPIGKVEWLYDIGVAAEEALEIRETVPPPAIITTHLNGDDFLDTQVPDTLTVQDLDTMPTVYILKVSINFYLAMDRDSTEEDLKRNRVRYGPIPLDPKYLWDPVKFPWWLASALDISDGEKCKMLRETSIRGRLKLCAKWALEGKQFRQRRDV